MRTALTALRAAAVRFGYGVGRVRGRRSGVLFATSHAASLSGNLRVVRADVAARHRGIAHRTFTVRPSRGAIARIRALWQSAVAGYRLATARVVLLDDYFFPLYVVPPLADATVVQLWHACGAFKKFGYSVLDKSFGADEEQVRRWPIHTNYDVCLVSSNSVAAAYSEAFRQPAEKFVSELGIPRTDILADGERASTIAATVRATYGIPTERRVLLYAPTFRGDRIVDARDPAGLDLALLEQRLGSDHVLLLRSHPFVRGSAHAVASSFMTDVSAHPEMNELLLVADVLITDYSSAIFEFALLGRPIVFFAPDHDAYERERGFYFDFPRDAPGPVFETTEALAEFLRTGDFDVDAVRAFARRSFDVADGDATRRFVDRVVVPAARGERVTPASLRASAKAARA